MLLIDGLQCSKFDRDVFLELRRGQLSCVTITLGFWEDTVESLEATVRFKELVGANSDLVQIARSADEIETSVNSGRTALLLGFQNTSALGGRIRFAQIFADLGVRVMQLTYNIQNDIGSSCYEKTDTGLSRFGREVVGEFNRLGILIDISHVGERSGMDAIELSRVPVAVTHANPYEVVPHARNKSTRLLRELAARGGVIGLATYPHLTGPYAESLDKWCELVLRAADICGPEHVAIGTDVGRKVAPADTQWMRMGRWTRIVNYGAGSASSPSKSPDPDWIEKMAGFPQIADELMRKGLSRRDAEGIMGGNWMRVYRDVFGSVTAERAAAE